MARTKNDMIYITIGILIIIGVITNVFRWTFVVIYIKVTMMILLLMVWSLGWNGIVLTKTSYLSLSLSLLSPFSSNVSPKISFGVE